MCPDSIAHVSAAWQIEEKTDVKFIVSHYCGTDVVFDITDLLHEHHSSKVVQLDHLVLILWIRFGMCHCWSLNEGSSWQVEEALTAIRLVQSCCGR